MGKVVEGAKRRRRFSQRAPKFGTTDWSHTHTDRQTQTRTQQKKYAIDGVDGEEAICGGLITKVTAKKGSAGQNLSGRERAIFTRAVNLRGFPPGVPTGVGKIDKRKEL